MPHVEASTQAPTAPPRPGVDEIKNDEIKIENDEIKNDEIKNDEIKIKNDEIKNDEIKLGILG